MGLNVNAMRAEWTKLRSVRSTTWMLLAMLGLTLLVTGLGAANTHTSGCVSPKGREGCEDAVALSLAGTYLGQLAIAALAVLAVTSEYTTGVIRTTFVADPRRRRVLLTRGTVVIALVFVVGLITAVASFLLGRGLLTGNGFTAANGYGSSSLFEGPALRAVGGTALYLAGVALLGLGVGAIVRHTAGAITSVLGLMLLPIMVASLFTPRIGDAIIKVSPVAGLAIQRTVKHDFPAAPWPGLAVLFAWGLAAAAGALVLIARRDA